MPAADDLVSLEEYRLYRLSTLGPDTSSDTLVIVKWSRLIYDITYFRRPLNLTNCPVSDVGTTSSFDYDYDDRLLAEGIDGTPNRSCLHVCIDGKRKRQIDYKTLVDDEATTAFLELKYPRGFSSLKRIEGGQLSQAFSFEERSLIHGDFGRDNILAQTAY